MAVSVSYGSRNLTAEILNRTQHSLLDLGVALIAGAAGVYAHCRRDAQSALSGVAIAVALAPPLATAGIGLARRLQARPRIPKVAPTAAGCDPFAIVFARVLHYSMLQYA
jgi:hypothetical protein